MTTLTAYRAEHLARKAEFGLTVAIILGAIEILRRTPRLLLVLLGLLLYTVVAIVSLYIWWVIAALATVIGWKLAQGTIRGWREAR